MSNRITVTGRTRDLVIFLQKLILGLTKYWEIIGNTVLGLVLGGAILAPALMAWGFSDAGQSLYDFYAPHNHQYPQRSYFLFSQEKGVQSYSLEEILTYGATPLSWQTFVGNPEIGFKMALNHRMTAIFIGLFLGGILWSVFYWQPKMTISRLLLLTVPMFIDAISHIISEQSLGFRESNQWASLITINLLPTPFYQGTTIGSLNWLLRTITGLLFGFGTIWYLYTYLTIRFTAIKRQLEPKLQKIMNSEK